MSHPQNTFINTTLSPNSPLARTRSTIAKSTLKCQLDVLKSTGRYYAFNLKWQPIYDDPPPVWPVPKHLFWDSDVAKWIEGACYFLHTEKNQEIEDAVHEL